MKDIGLSAMVSHQNDEFALQPAALHAFTHMGLL